MDTFTFKRVHRVRQRIFDECAQDVDDSVSAVLQCLDDLFLLGNDVSLTIDCCKRLIKICLSIFKLFLNCLDVAFAKRLSSLNSIFVGVRYLACVA